MTNPNFLSIAEVLGWTLVHSIWQIVLIALLLKGALMLSSNQSARLRYGFSLMAVASVFCAAILTFYWSYHPIASYEGGQLLDRNASLALDSIFELGSRKMLSNWELWIMQLEQYLPYLTMTWILGVFIHSSKTIGGYFQLHRLQYQHSQSVSTDWQQRLARLQEQLGINRKVELLATKLLDEPITFRHFKPVILLPASLLSGLSVEQLEVLLLHELAHIRRYDYLVNWVQSSLEVLFFYHPAFWWISRQVRTEREHCCDDLVLQCHQQPLLYAQTLTQLQLNFYSLKTNLAMSATKNQGVFTTRIHRLFGKYYAPNRQRKGAVLTILLAISVLTMAFYEPSTLQSISDLEQQVLQYQDSIPRIDNNGVLSEPGDLEKIGTDCANSGNAEIAVYQIKDSNIQEGFYFFNKNGNLIHSDIIDLEEITESMEAGKYAFVINRNLKVESNNNSSLEKPKVVQRIFEEAFKENESESDNIQYHEDAELDEEGDFHYPNSSLKIQAAPILGEKDILSLPLARTTPQIVNGGKQLLDLEHGKEKPLIVIDGEIYPKRKGDAVKVDPAWVKSMVVLKGQKAIDKYGKKARYGAIEITMKSYKEYSKEHQPRAMVLNGAIYDNMDTEEKSLRALKVSDVEDYNARVFLQPEEGIKKYGEVAKGGIWELYTDESMIDVEYPTVGLAPEKVSIKGDPLLVIDGEIIDYGTDIKAYIRANLKPKQIRSINIWKGEDALEKYSTLGENGVLEIATKQWKGPKVSFNRESLLEEDNISLAETTIQSTKSNATKDSSFRDSNDITLSIYPNPAQEVVNISFKTPRYSKAALSIFDMQGNLLKQFKGKRFDAKNLKGNCNVSWNVADRPSGTYLVALRVNKKQWTKQFVVN